MSEKKNDLFTVGIIAAILLAVAVTDILYLTGVLYRDPARRTEVHPVATTGRVLNGQYFEEWDEYALTHFYNQNKWSRLVRDAELFLGRREFNGIWIGKKGTYFEESLPQAYDEAAAEKSLAFLEKAVQEYDARVMLLPTADVIWADRLPRYAEAPDQASYLSKVKERIGEEAYVDLYAVMEEHKKEAVYYRTDPHWTSLGAYYGYYAWWKQSGRLMPYYYDLGEREIVTENFVGPLATRAGMEDRGEQIFVFEETQGKMVTVNYDGRVDREGFYRPEYLESGNPYGYFLGDGFGMAKISTGLDRRTQLVVFGDGNANAMVPLMAPHYATIYLVDLSRWQGDPWSLLSRLKEDGTDVLVLQSVPGILETFGLKGVSE